MLASIAVRMIEALMGDSCSQFQVSTFHELRTVFGPWWLELEVDMGTLRSDLFKDDPKLEACATSPAGHIAPAKPGQVPPRGAHVAKIHEALAILEPGATIQKPRRLAWSTALRPPTPCWPTSGGKKIINTSYQHEADNIVGQMTIAKMDEELFGKPAPRTGDRQSGLQRQPRRAPQRAEASPKLAKRD